MSYLIPIECPKCKERFWGEIGIKYDKYVFEPSLLDLDCYVLKYANLKDVYPDKEIIYDVKRTLASFIKDDYETEDVVKEVSLLYGIPEFHVKEILEGLMVEMV